MERSAGRARLRWALAICWNLAVLLASFGAMSAANTGSIVVAVLQAIAPSLDAATVNTIHFAIRKLAHLTEYGILSALYADAQRRSDDRPLRLFRWSAIAVTICAVTAILDEWHQSFVPSRTGAPRDVAIDIAGAIVAQVIWAAANGRSGRGATSAD
jgi:VanZ family protein